MRVGFLVLVVGVVGCGRTAVGAECRRADRFAGAVESWDPRAGGFEPPQQAEFVDPTAALGPPDYTGGGEGRGAVAIGQGGVLTLRFSRCLLTADGTPDADLRVYEVGGFVERLWVSGRPAAGAVIPVGLVPDADGFVELGTVEGLESDIDIDAVLREVDSYELLMDTVRLHDDPNDGPANAGSPGADIDAVRILSGVSRLHP